MTQLHIGLENIAIAESHISSVNGDKGELIYRGHWAEEIVHNHCFEDIVFLLWYGHIPSAEDSTAFIADLAARRTLPAYITQLIDNLPRELTPMAVLRAALAAFVPVGDAWPPTLEQGKELLAKAPTIIAYYHAITTGQTPVAPHPDYGHVANYLYMLHGAEPSQADTRALEMYIMLAADHDMNASTFTSRVVTSTQSDMISAITAAIGSLIGPLHGGAPSKVDDMLDLIGSKDNAEAWLREQLDSGQRLMGFGHRVYKTYDPRAAALKVVTEQFADQNSLFDLSLHVEKVAIALLKEYKPEQQLYPNLEFWAAAILRTVQLPRELYTPTFCLSRIGGWVAHIMEQAANNRLIRPSCVYVGPRPTTAPPHVAQAIDE